MNKFKVGDMVEVIDQNIKGKVLEVYFGGHNIVIDDLDSEWSYPESRLEYKQNELRLLEAVK
jgi:hypothetical protein